MIPITVKEAVENIHHKKYLLPSIQREACGALGICCIQLHFLGGRLVPISVIQKVITPLEDLDGPRLRAHRGKRWSFAAKSTMGQLFGINLSDATNRGSIHFVEYSPLVTLRPTMKTFENKTVLITGGALRHR
jgi:hypothetical protein